MSNDQNIYFKQRATLPQLQLQKQPILTNLKYSHTRNITSVSLEPLKPQEVKLLKNTQPAQPNELKAKQLPTKLLSKVKNQNMQEARMSLNQALDSNWKMPTLTQPQRINLDMIVSKLKNIVEPSKSNQRGNKNNCQSFSVLFKHKKIQSLENPYQYTKKGFYDKRSMREYFKDPKPPKNDVQNSCEYTIFPLNLSNHKSKPVLQIFSKQISFRQNSNASQLLEPKSHQHHFQINPARHTSFDSKSKKQWTQLQTHNISPYEMGINHHRVIMTDPSLDKLHAHVSNFEKKFITQNSLMKEFQTETEYSDEEILERTSQDLLKLIEIQ